MKQINYPYSSKKLLMDRFLKTSKGVTKREGSFANKILNEIDDLSFWKTYDLGFKLNSLAFFLGGKGLDTLRRDYKKFSMKIEESPKLELLDERVGEDVQISSTKKKGLLSFLS